MSLVELYKDLLDSVNAQVDDHGLLSFESFGVKQPLEIDGKRLALPTPEILALYGRGEAVVPFHPMSESSNRGESTVLQLLKKLIRLRLSTSLTTLLQDLVNISADSSMHKKMSPDAHRMLSCMPEADEKTVAAVEKIIRAMGEDTRRSLNLYLKRRGRLDGKEHARVAVVKFPLYEELCKDDDTSVFGVKLRKRDYVGLRKLVEYILPDLEEAEGYAVGSNHLLVPYLDSLTRCYIELAKQINKIVKIQRPYLAEPGLIKIPITWAGKEIDWAQYRDAIPPLEESMGIVMPTEKQRQNARAAAPTMSSTAVRNALQVNSPLAASREDTPPWQETAPTPVAAAPAVRTVGAPAPMQALQPGKTNEKTIDDVLNARMGIQQPMGPVSGQMIMTPQGPMLQPYQQQVQMQPTAVLQTRPGDYPGRHRGALVQPSIYGYFPQAGGYVQMPQIPETASAYAPAQPMYQPGIQYAPTV